jgi:hypothetical protein
MPENKDKVIIIITSGMSGPLNRRWLLGPEVAEPVLPDLQIQYYEPEGTTKKKEKRKPRWQRQWKE